MKRMLSLCAGLILALASPALSQTADTWADAKWVWDEPDANSVTQNNDPRYLRRTFDLAVKPTAAELWITVDNIYVVYVNGQKVGEDKEWSTVERYDVAKHL